MEIWMENIKEHLAPANPGWEEAITLLNNSPKMSISYLAGLIDGEGTIGVYFRKSDRYTHGGHHVPTVRIANNNLELLKRVQQIFGGSIGTPQGNTFNWVWSLSEIRTMLPQLEPHLILKRAQATIVLKFLETFQESIDTAPQPISDEMFKWRENLCAATMALNSHKAMAVFNRGHLITIKMREELWEALTVIERQRLLPKIKIVAEFTSYMLEGMWKGTKKYASDDWSLERWMAHIMDEGADQANYQILMFNKWRQERQEELDAIERANRAWESAK